VIAAIDNTFLTLLLNPVAEARPNPATGKPVSHCRQRIEALVDDLSRQNGTLLVPALTLAEALCASDAIESYFNDLQQYSAIEVAPFDARAAYELGRIIRTANANGDKRSGQAGHWQHVKMDRAIVAIAVSRSATVFYSDDNRQIAFANFAGLIVKSTWDLDLPPEHAQPDLSEQLATPWPQQRKTPKSSAS
jgi:predicted nucleic acid-binding protein